MAILTKFLKLLKPEKNDYVDVEKHLSENYDKIDAKMEELSNSNDKKLDKGAVSTEYDTAKKIEDKIKTKLNQGNVPNVLNSAEKIFKALQGNTGIKFDENLLYLNDEGTKKVGLCYLDRLTDGIFECIQETTTTVNNATYFKNFSNKENSDRLSNLSNFMYETAQHDNCNAQFQKIGNVGICILEINNINSYVDAKVVLPINLVPNWFRAKKAVNFVMVSIDGGNNIAECIFSEIGIVVWGTLPSASGQFVVFLNDHN